jgi:hypothetical protein
VDDHLAASPSDTEESQDIDLASHLLLHTNSSGIKRITSPLGINTSSTCSFASETGSDTMALHVETDTEEEEELLSEKSRVTAALDDDVDMSGDEEKTSDVSSTERIDVDMDDDDGKGMTTGRRGRGWGRGRSEPHIVFSSFV